MEIEIFKSILVLLTTWRLDDPGRDCKTGDFLSVAIVQLPLNQHVGLKVA